MLEAIFSEPLTHKGKILGGMAQGFCDPYKRPYYYMAVSQIQENGWLKWILTAV